MTVDAATPHQRLGLPDVKSASNRLRPNWVGSMLQADFTPEGLVVILTAAGSGVGRQTAVLARHFYAAVSWAAFNALSCPPSAHLEKKI